MFLINRIVATCFKAYIPMSVLRERPYIMNIKYSVRGLLALISLWGPGWAAPAPKTTILMIQWRGETPAEKGFKEELKNLNINVKFIIFNADQNKDKLLKYLHSDLFKKINNINYIYTFGTTASETVKRVLPDMNSPRIVQVINIVADPIAAKFADGLSAAGGNRIVGCQLVDLETQLQNASRIFKFHKMGFIFNPREENSNIQLFKMTDLAEKMGFKIILLRTKPEKHDLEDVINQIEEKRVDIDCVYLVSESFLVSNAGWVVKRLNAAKLPTIAAIEQFMKEGALMGTISSYYKLGQLVAKTVAKDIKNAHSINNYPVVLDPNPEFMINLSTASSLNIKINEKATGGAKFIP